MGNTGLQETRVECRMNKLLNNNNEITVGVDPRRVRVFLLKGTSKCVGQVVTRGKCLGQVMTRDMFLDQWHGLWKHFLFEGDPLLYSYVWKNPSFLKRKHYVFETPIVFLSLKEPLFLWEKNVVFFKGIPSCTPSFKRTPLFMREKCRLFQGDPFLYS